MDSMTTKGSRFTKKGVTYCRHTNIILNCLFCNIINRLEPGRIVFENNHYCVFRTIQPVTSMHLLVVPKRHIQNVSVLEGQEGISEVEALLSVGREALLGLGGSQEVGRYAYILLTLDDDCDCLTKTLTLQLLTIRLPAHIHS